MRHWIFAGIGILLFLVYSYLMWGKSLPLYSWPDEMANAFFIEQFANTTSLRVEQPYDVFAHNLVTPRSMTLRDGFLVPVGFVGLPVLYGLIAKVIGGMHVFITPLLAVLCVYLMYRVVSMVWDERMGRVSALLLAVYPPFVYYASFTLLPNIAFVAGLMTGLFFLLKNFYHRRYIFNYIFSALAFSSAVMIRPNEVIWFGVALVVLLWVYRKDIQVFDWIVFGFTSATMALIYFFINFQTYRSYLPSGYTTQISQTGEVQTQAWSVMKLFFPFGIDLSMVWQNLVTFVIPVQWPYMILAVFGVVAFLGVYKERDGYAYLGGVAILTAYLLIYYGSWELVDSFVGSHSQLGISYNRYWLPIGILMIPMSAYFLVDIGKRSSRVMLGGVLVAVSVLSLYIVFLHGPDSLMRIRQALHQQERLHAQIISLTEEESVIMTHRGDKIVFPQRQVISQYDPADLSGVRALLTHEIPVYYLIYKDELFVQQENEQFFTPQGLTREQPQILEGDYLLYEITE